MKPGYLRFQVTVFMPNLACLNGHALTNSPLSIFWLLKTVTLDAKHVQRQLDPVQVILYTKSCTI